MTATQAIEEAARLTREVSRQKGLIRVHKQSLHDAKAALEALTATCRRLGIALHIVHPGEGAIHGHDPHT